MRKQYLLAAAFGISMAAFAQSDYTVPAEVEFMVAQRVSQNGKHIAGQDALGSVVYLYDVENGDITEYYQFCIGNGNCIANNGMIVGQRYGDNMQPAVMYNGNGEVPKSLSGVGTGTLDAITPDGTRAVGWRQNNGSVQYVPFYVDIAEDGTVGKANALPYPRNDFFNDVPQSVNAIAISDDGRTIVGFVLDSSGFYSWPIVYTQDEVTGKWSYTQPTEDEFNPDNLPLPKFPDIEWGKNGAPAPPNFLDFMTPEEREAYYDALEKDPNINFVSYMSKESYDAYEAASIKFHKEADAYLDNVLDPYWRQMQATGFNEQYLINMTTISPDGKLIL